MCLHSESCVESTCKKICIFYDLYDIIKLYVFICMKQIKQFQGSNCFSSEFECNFKEVQELELWKRGAALLTVYS